MLEALTFLPQDTDSDEQAKQEFTSTGEKQTTLVIEARGLFSPFKSVTAPLCEKVLSTIRNFQLEIASQKSWTTKDWMPEHLTSLAGLEQRLGPEAGFFRV